MITRKYAYLVFLIYNSYAKEVDNEKVEFCANISSCDNENNKTVCGIRRENELFHLKLFKNECELLKLGCQVDNDDEAYGIINLEYCEKSFVNYTIKNDESNNESLVVKGSECDRYNCSDKIDKDGVCGIRQHDEGFKVRLFANECELLRFNCRENLIFNITDFYICKTNLSDNESEPDAVTITHEDVTTEKPDNNTDFEQSNDKILIENDTETDIDVINTTNETPQLEELVTTPNVNKTPIVILAGSKFNHNDNVNDTLMKFLDATHKSRGLPLKEINLYKNESLRRNFIKNFGPLMVFEPWVIVPKEVNEDFEHQPLLQSCYHKCPKVEKNQKEKKWTKKNYGKAYFNKKFLATDPRNSEPTRVN